MCPTLTILSVAPQSGRALLLAGGLLPTSDAKTCHGLIRGPSRFDVAAVIDGNSSGRDAGTVLDGKPRGIPILPSVEVALASLLPRPSVCIVGIATHGGVLPESLREDLRAAAQGGLCLVSGLHALLSDDKELCAIARSHGASVFDIRRPRPTSELRFWTGEVLALSVPRVAILGMDCAIGKRTTTQLLARACRQAGLKAEVIFTGQTGWLQGDPYGFILDATPNDFVAGELEGAILRCAAQARPDVILIEGQSSLRNPAGPCGSEFLLSAGARHVVLQHAPGREHFDGLEFLQRRIPSLAEELELIRLYGGDVFAVTLNEAGLSDPAAEQKRVQETIDVPVLLPLRGELQAVVQKLAKIGKEAER